MRLLVAYSVLLFPLAVCLADCTSSLTQLEDELFQKGRWRDFVDYSISDECLKTWGKEGTARYYWLKSYAYYFLEESEGVDQSMESLLNVMPDFQPVQSHASSDHLSRFLQKKKTYLSNVVSVTKFAQDQASAPANVLVISGKELIRRGYQSLTELLEDLPGFDITIGKGPAYSNVYMRGVRSNQSDHVLLLIDGVEMNDLSSQNAFLSRQYALTNIDHVEVVYGPISTVYGANAFSGVINIITFDGPQSVDVNRNIDIQTRAFGGKLETYGAEGAVMLKTSKAAATISGRLFSSNENELAGTSNFDFQGRDRADYLKSLATSDPELIRELSPMIGSTDLFDLSIQESDSLLTPTENGVEAAYQKDNQLSPLSNFNNQSFNHSINTKVSAGNFTIGHHFWRKKEGNVGWYNWRHAGSDFDANWIVTNSSIFAKYVQNGLLPNSALDLMVFIRYKSHKIDPETRFVRVQSYAAGGLTLLDLVRGEHARWDTTYFYRTSNQLRTELRANYHLSLAGFSVADVAFGVESRDSRIQGDYINSVNDPLISEIANNLTNEGDWFHYKDAGFFSELTLQKGEFTSIVGGRLDWNTVGLTGGYGWTQNLRVAMVYEGLPTWYFKPIITTAFKDASAFNKYSSTSTREPNPDLMPERIINYELTVLKKSKNWSGTVSAYHAAISNLLGNLVTEQGLSQNQTIGRGKVSGLQVSAEGRWRDVSWFTNYTFTDSRISNDTTNRLAVADISAHRFNAGAGLKVGSRWYLHGRANVVGRRPTGVGTTVPSNPLKEVPGYALIDAVVTYRFQEASKHQVQLSINNLLNQPYAHPGVRTAGDGTYAPSIPQNGIYGLFTYIYVFDSLF